MNLVPREYQVQGTEFLRERKRAGLFDKAGLGKTLQAAQAAERPAIVIAPTYLTQQWYDFLCEEFPNDDIALCEGTRAQRQAELDEPADWHIINTEMLRGYRLPIDKKTHIYDEAHSLRNRNALQSKMARAYSKTAEQVFLLTATPIVKDPDDIWHLLHIIDPKRWNSYEAFVYNYCKVGASAWSQEILGFRNINKFRDVLREFAMWRSYEDVALELPEMLPPVRIRVPFDDVTKKIYKMAAINYWLETEGGPIALTNAMQMMQALRRITLCQPKVDALLSLVRDIGDSKPIVIFCWYKDTVKSLAAILGPKAVAITGDEHPTARTRLAKSPHYKYRVATLASLSEGVDMSDSRTIIYFEEDWTPGRMYQSESRVRRWSKNGLEPIRMYHITMLNSIDETVHDMQERRSATVSDLMKEALKPYEQEARQLVAA